MAYFLLPNEFFYSLLKLFSLLTRTIYIHPIYESFNDLSEQQTRKQEITSFDFYQFVTLGEYNGRDC